MDKEVKCPKCRSDKRVKSGFSNKKQRYLYKKCGHNYTVGQHGYPEHIKRKAIQLYLEGNGFRRIEIILKVSHVSVINWVKKAGAKLEKVPKKDEKADVLELDELCVNLKNIWLWTAVDRATKRLVGFQIGTRETKHFQKLADKISHIDARFYASNHLHTYNIIDPAKHLTGKAYTYTVERMNRLLRHYLARFARKIHCYSKSLQMIKYSLLLFMYRDFIKYMKV